MLKYILKTAAVSAVVVALAGAVVFQGCTDNPADNSVVDKPGDGPGNNVVTGGKTVDELLNDGNEALSGGDIASASAYYEAAYKKDPKDVRAVVYSSLMKIASISVDPKVGDLFKNHFGFEKYPSSFTALLNTGSWMKNYPETELEYDYYDNDLGDWVSWYGEWDVEWIDEIDRAGYYYYDYDAKKYQFVSGTPRYEVYENQLPGLLTPDWIKGDKNSAYSKSLYNNAPTMETWAILLFANLVDKNTAGLNSLLDDVISSVFGNDGSFKQACDRIAALDKEATVQVSALLIDGIFEGELITDGEVGWAELNAFVSLLTGVKASLEWVAAYDWNTNLSVLKHAWRADEEYVLERFKALNVNDLPFKNSLTNGRAGKMAAAKSDFIKAIQGIDASYKVIRDRDYAPRELQIAYPIVHDGISKLVAAIESNGVFWIPDPENLTEESLYWPTGDGANVIGGIDMGKLFQEGYFSLSNLFETESDKAPSFYTENGVKLTKDNWEGVLEEAYDEGYMVGFKLKTSVVTAIVREGGAFPIELPRGDQILPIFTPEGAALFFAKYNGLNLPSFKKRGAQVALLKERSGK